MKQFFRILTLAIFTSLLWVVPVSHAAVGPVTVDVFERQDCTHCQDEKVFLEGLKKEIPSLQITYRDISEAKYKDQFIQVAESLQLSKATPVTVVGGKVLQGFNTPETTGKSLRDLITQAQVTAPVNFETALDAGSLVSAQGGGSTCDAEGECTTGFNEYWVNVPFYGPVNVAKYSLPALSLILGFVDGFNPCAMWVLVMFLALLMESGSRRRMLEMAGLFIIAEAIMYYLILNVWMTAWDFVGMDRIVTPIVGVVALGAGSWFLYLFIKKDDTCKVGDMSVKKRTVDKIRGYVNAPMTILVALGILGLAFSVNIIEFACSIGIPQTFTKILDMNYLSWVGKQFYNFLYILMYMVDDLIVFAAALYSFDKIGLTTAKYTRVSHFIGGAIMVAIGLIMLIKPSLLIFG
ncbi:MAG: glutaredoxin [Candidatus Peregrinibacteria bacterium]